MRYHSLVEEDDDKIGDEALEEQDRKWEVAIIFKISRNLQGKKDEIKKCH